MWFNDRSMYNLLSSQKKHINNKNNKKRSGREGSQIVLGLDQCIWELLCRDYADHKIVNCLLLFKCNISIFSLTAIGHDYLPSFSPWKWDVMIQTESPNVLVWLLTLSYLKMGSIYFEELLDQGEHGLQMQFQPTT